MIFHYYFFKSNNNLNLFFMKLDGLHLGKGLDLFEH